MGCAFCKDPSNGKSQDPDYQDERSRLLDHDHSKSPTRPINDSSDYSTVNSMTKTDEQSILSRILHKTAQNIIDVSAIEPHSMERSEYMDKMRHYLEKTSNSEFYLPKTKLVLSSVTHAPMNVLSADSINQADIKFITDASISVATALSQIQIICKEPLVETFEVDKVAVAT